MAAIYKALPPFYAALREGSSGPDVALVQTWLDGLRGEWPALPKLKLDGRFGSDTRSAVRIFQLANGLREDGVVGRETWNALYSRFADQNGAGERYPGIVIRKGNRGAVVRSVQQKLKKLVPNLRADGYFGQKTEAAVLAWQASNGLTMDGMIGQNTWNSLYSQTAK